MKCLNTFTNRHEKETEILRRMGRRHTRHLRQLDRLPASDQRIRGCAVQVVRHDGGSRTGFRIFTLRLHRAKSHRYRTAAESRRSHRRTAAGGDREQPGCRRCL